MIDGHERSTHDRGPWGWFRAHAPSTAAGHSLDLPGIGDQNADPEKDGFSNRLEYALAGDPLKSSTDRAPTHSS